MTLFLGAEDVTALATHEVVMDAARAAVAAERIDEELSDRGAVIAFGTPTIGELASPRLSCREQSPFSFGDDLARLCLAHG